MPPTRSRIGRGSASTFFPARQLLDRLRKLNTIIPTLESLNCRRYVRQIRQGKDRLVLVTGATGSGKSTTLAALLNEINRSNRAVHIITLEDPVEYVHPQKKATFNQRELGTDFDNFASGLRAALRQAPKVILVGEMRDRETVEIGLSAAETGHLVLEHAAHHRRRPDHQPHSRHVRNRGTGAGPGASGRHAALDGQPAAGAQGRRRPHALLEIMGSNLRTKETIRLGESEGKSFYEIIEASYPFGWRTFDIPAWKPTSRARSPRKPPCSIAPNAAPSRAASTTSRNAAANHQRHGQPAHEDVRRSGQIRRAYPCPSPSNSSNHDQRSRIYRAERQTGFAGHQRARNGSMHAKTVLAENGIQVHAASNHDDFIVRFGRIQYQLVLIEELVRFQYSRG
jgi:energy-coupling factor transporter ATP-binding protein EcfA2